MKKKICIVVASYYPKISSSLLKGTLKYLKRNKFKHIKIIYAPGIFEIPIIIKKKIKIYDAFVALGCVIKGKTPHFDFISRSTINAIMLLSINTGKPIGNGIITCLNKNQAIQRSDISKKDKGGEAAKAVVSILKL